jgi:hypothetical protein
MKLIFDKKIFAILLICFVFFNTVKSGDGDTFELEEQDVNNLKNFPFINIPTIKIKK